MRIGDKAAIATFVLLIVAFAYFAIVTAEQNDVLAHQADASVRTEHALCILRTDLKQRVEDSKQFLKDHPDGIPGISAEQIQTSIDNQTSTVDALALLECEQFNT